MKVGLYTDGGARGNPGPAAIGAVIEQDGRVVEKYGESIGEATNNQAEYRALVFGLKKIRSVYGKKKAKDLEVEVFADSELLVKQLNHEYKIKDETIRGLFIEIWNLTLDFKQVNFNYIPREKNKEADKQLNDALDGKGDSQALF